MGRGARTAPEVVPLDSVADAPVAIEADDPPARRRSPPVGYLLLVLGVIVALALPGLIGRREPGVAVPAPPPQPPTAGQCRAPLVTESQLARWTDQALVDCGQAHSAEIVALIQLSENPDAADVSAIEIRRGRTSRDILETCAAHVKRFLGVSATPALSEPVIPNHQVLIGTPTEYQAQTGQNWITCELAPGYFSLPVSYTGSARGIAASGPVPPIFARCASVIGGPPVSCLEPHLAEKISADVEPDGSTTPDCHEVAQRLIGRADPTFESTVSVTAWRDEFGLACWATSGIGERLPPTLIGWGEKPLPIG